MKLSIRRPGACPSLVKRDEAIQRRARQLYQRQELDVPELRKVRVSG